MSDNTDKIAYKDLVERYRKIFNEYYELKEQAHEEGTLLKKLYSHLIEDYEYITKYYDQHLSSIIDEVTQHYLNKEQEDK